MANRIRVGIVGCGEVAQIIHVPALKELRDLFDITALCDVSRSVLGQVGASCPGADLFEDYCKLIAAPTVDAVLVANPDAYHAEVVIAAIKGGKHVLLEKPIAVTLAEADAMLAAEAAAATAVQVGYMRRYAPAFLEAVATAAKVRSEIVLARVHDVIGPNATIIDNTSNIFRANDLSAEFLAEGKRALRAKIGEAIGVASGSRAVAYALLLSLSSHALSAMRELLGGMPKGVLYAAQRHGGRFLSAAFDYGHFVAQFEAGVDRIPHFDAHLEVYTPAEIIRVDYDTPYVRHLPARMTTIAAETAAGVAVRSMFPTRNDSFVAEWRAFHGHITRGTRPKTTLADARNDLVLARDMAAKMD
ncbi:MAG: Gfo/Idh/MocA family oxidoreductase [Methylobacteriaceae bacterium]|nr:Gfo/Idh/MocA family oxidoreductase [Methylobacteriaceae bacterium]MBV9222293.1 Gfo/Idh/MocA family oxidoreductase [Methylobacteriaceae bacterium]MBV9633592.1 Gfo/Idh/MocA family oxidoreductase [Methylobacteriaceae bacterium]MBV9705085.1 Gfo/Idh/MocA family oxidoreductase [Methylobacteriaceae bacterium]